MTLRTKAFAAFLAAVAGAVSAQPAGHEGFYGAIDRARTGAGVAAGKDSGLPLGSVQAVADDAECRARLAEAVQLSGAGKRAEAAALYSEISEKWPDQGLAAEGRFLRLAGKPEDIDGFLARLEARRGTISTLAMARGLAAAGSSEKALETLLADPATASGRAVGQTVLAASLLRDARREEEREQLLYRALMAAEAPESRSLIFEKLIAGEPKGLFASADDFARALDAGLPILDPVAVRGSNLMQEATLDFIAQADYFRRRDALLEKAKTAGAGAAWFATRLIVREERHADALAYLDPLETAMRGKEGWPLLAQEKVELLRTLRRFAEAEAIQKTLAQDTTEPAASRAKFELSRTALARKDDAAAIASMKEINPDYLDEVSRNAHWMTYVLAVARLGDLEQLADVYAKAAPRIREDDLDFVHEQIFQAITSTDQHLALEDLIRKRFEKDPSTEPMLWILASKAAIQARKAPNELEALYQYAQLRPRDFRGLERLATAVGPVAAGLIQAPKEALAVPQAEVEKVAELADQSLRALIAARPYAPENYKILMDLRKAQGKDPVQVPIEAVADSRDAKLVENAGYVLATNGYPAEALKLYDRALELDPKNTKIRLNRASALTRLGRWDEATEFYWKLLEEGEDGHKYHVHELVMRLFDISVETKKEKEFLDRFHALLERWDRPWKYEAMGDAATLLGRRERLDESEKLFRLLAASAPEAEIRQKAWRELIYSMMNAGKPDRAEKAVADAERAMADVPDAVLEFRQVHVDLLAQLERRPEAIALLRSMITDFPKTENTLLFPFRLAELAEEEGDMAAAVKAYEEFLASESRDFARRNEAKARLEQLRASLPKKGN